MSGGLHELAARPGGRLLLALLAVGLAAQVVWRAVQALTDIERPRGRAPRWTSRFGWSCIGAFYASLFVHAVGLMIHHPGASHAHKRSLLDRALTHSAGRAILFAVAIGLGVFAVVELYKVWRATFLDDFDRRTLTPARRRGLALVGRVGLVGRALLFGAAAALLMRSAWRARADTITTGDVLRHLVAGRFGAPLVGAIAVALFAYAALMIFEAAWRYNVQPPAPPGGGADGTRKAALR